MKWTHAVAMSLAISMFASSRALAEWISPPTRITSIGVYNDGHVVITLENNPTTRPACQSSTVQYSLGLFSSGASERMVEIAMAAYLSGKRVIVRALDTCNGSERTLQYIMVVP